MGYNLVPVATTMCGIEAGESYGREPGDNRWGTYAGMFSDKYGIEWIMEFDPDYAG